MKTILVRLFDLLRKGEIKFLVNGILKRVYSQNDAFYFRRDLNLEYKKFQALLDLTVRPFNNDDREYFLMDLQNEGLIEKEIPNCYVAISKEGIPCFRLWLMGSTQNDKIQEFWGDAFPILKENEAIIESVFTVPDYRGHNIMPQVMCETVEKGIALGLRWIMLFVATDNIGSLKGCHRSGFEPYQLRTEKWFMFKRTVVFKKIPIPLLDTYIENVSVSSSSK